jgi:hypothetical protein
LVLLESADYAVMTDWTKSGKAVRGIYARGDWWTEFVYVTEGGNFGITTAALSNVHDENLLCYSSLCK